jgi:hypothetical protein
MKKLMVETIQYMQVIDTHVEVPCTTLGERNTSLAKMSNSIAFSKTSKPQEIFLIFQNKLIFKKRFSKILINK